MGLEHWHLLESRYLVSNRFLRLRQDTVRLPDGSIYDEYFVTERSDWAAVFCLTEDGHVILTEQYKHGIGEVVLEFPAGGLAEGEEPLFAAQRELFEETGYRSDHWEEVGQFIADPTSEPTRITLFLARDAEEAGAADTGADATENIRVHRVRLNQLLHLVDDGAITVQGHVAFALLCLRRLGHLRDD